LKYYHHFPGVFSIAGFDSDVYQTNFSASRFSSYALITTSGTSYIIFVSGVSMTILT